MHSCNYYEYDTFAQDSKIAPSDPADAIIASGRFIARKNCFTVNL